jgi:LytS/YehU family sensor histidine kinase
VRFSDRLQVRISVADAVREWSLPRLLVQPLVENAIRHGVEPREGQVQVHIKMDAVNGALRILVADTGNGFSFDQQAQLPREGIGITNTRSRLAHLFGERASLELRNAPGGGAESVVTIPVLQMGATSAGDGAR